MNKILVGSRAFFSGMKGFHSKDQDYLILVDNPQGFSWRREQSIRGVCRFEYKKDTPAAMVAKTLEHGDAMLLGKFLVPQFAEAIGATVQDILPLEALLPKLDQKHQYEAVIFQAIKENKSFDLTDEQRAAAYEAYMQARKKPEDEQKHIAQHK